MAAETSIHKYIQEQDTLWLLGNVIESFSSGKVGTGLPLGNLTSQLLVNIYMNEFDQFVKHKPKVRYYIRYADDFVFLSHNKNNLKNLVSIIQEYLQAKLKLTVHSDKLFLKTFASGLDFLGWVHFLDHRVLRTSTKRRMFKNLVTRSLSEVSVGNGVLNSYLGLLCHGNGWKLKQRLGRDVRLLFEVVSGSL